MLIEHALLFDIMIKNQSSIQASDRCTQTAGSVNAGNQTLPTRAAVLDCDSDQ